LKNDLLIRKGTKKDARAFLKLLVGLANFEHLEPPDAAGKKRIVNDLFERKRAKLLLAFWKGCPAGYALYFYTYSSFLAKPTFYLEDIFVFEEFRKRGIGKSLFVTCLEEAKRNNCARFEFAVLTWNENAIKFYEKMGARRLDDWYYYRMNEDTIRNSIQSRRQKTRHA
jgi:GNAT superfamily N-acetyltransferase